MKKLLALVFGLAILAFGTSAFAEVTYDDILTAMTENHSMSKTFDMSLITLDGNGEPEIYHSEKENYNPLRPENTAKIYQFVFPEDIDADGYNGEGVIEYFEDYFAEEEMHYPYLYAEWEENDNLRAVAIVPETYLVGLGLDMAEKKEQIEQAVEYANDMGVNIVYDAYLFEMPLGLKWKENNVSHIQNQRDHIYLSTDKGDFVISFCMYSVGGKTDEYAELMSMEDLLDRIAYVVKNSGSSTQIIEYVDENGDESTKTIETQNRTWDIDRFIALSLKNHSISDTFDISLLHQDADGNYLAVGEPNGEDYDTIIDLSKVLKAYHIAVEEKSAVVGYDGSGFAEYFADYFIDGEQHLYRYIMTNRDGEFYNLLITDDEYHYTLIGNLATEWKDGINDALAVLNNSSIGEIYDAYSIDWSTRIRYSDNSRRSVRIDEGIYLDTDKGEFVIFYNDGEESIFAKKFTKAERLKLYPVQDFLDIVAKNYDEAGVIVRENVEIVNKDGDSEQVTIVQKPVQSEDKEEKEDSEQPKRTEQEDKEEAEQQKKEENAEQPEKTDIDVILYGKKLVFPDQKPIVDSNRVLVPLRVIFEALEAEVLWDGETQTVTAIKGDITISLTLGEKKIVKNGEVIEIDVPAQAQNERTLVPIRVVSESFGNTVSWDGANKIVEIK